LLQSSRFYKFSLACALVLSAIASVARPAEQDKELTDTAIEIQETKKDGVYALWLMPPRLQEATLSIETESENMSFSQPCPFTMDINTVTMAPTQPKPILSVQQINTALPWKFHWHFYWQFGIRGGAHDDSVIYHLPFQRGTASRVGQGYMGKYSHLKGSETEYALDFEAPEGTLVCATRPGIVVAVRGDSNVGGQDLKKYANAANYVVVKHSDGTYANYLHLSYKSPIVSLGQNVVTGQPIGRVGSTGAVTSPHLHFDVGVPIDGHKRKTLPTQFICEEGEQIQLQEGQNYTAN
jgi:murein DD-endopeptidase MepM/ murein hydrolase activator NlpD